MQPGAKKTSVPPPRSRPPSAGPTSGSIPARSLRPTSGGSIPVGGLPLSGPPIGPSGAPGPVTGLRIGSEPPPPSSRPPAAHASWRASPVGGKGSSVAPLPWDPTQGLPQSVFDPKLKILEAPQQKQSRRGLILGIVGVAIVGMGITAYEVVPHEDLFVNWDKRVLPLSWGSGSTGAIFYPDKAEREPCPVLVTFDPFQKAAEAVRRFAPLADRHGWIVASSNAIGREPKLSDAQEMRGLVEAVRASGKTDGRPVFAEGYDRCGEIAYRLACVAPDVVAGVISECASRESWRDVAAFANAGTPVYLFTRNQRRDESHVLRDEMQQKGMRVTLVEGGGASDPMERPDIESAFVWLDGLRGLG